MGCNTSRHSVNAKGRVTHRTLTDEDHRARPWGRGDPTAPPGSPPESHWMPQRITAHVKLCALALMIQRAAEIATAMTWRQLQGLLSPIKAVRYTTEGRTIVQAGKIGPEGSRPSRRSRFGVWRGWPWSCGLGGGDEVLGVGGWGFELGHGLDLHVSMLQLPFVVGLQKDGANEADDALLVGEDADDNEGPAGRSSDPWKGRGQETAEGRAASPPCSGAPRGWWSAAWLGAERGRACRRGRRPRLRP